MSKWSLAFEKVTPFYCHYLNETPTSSKPLSIKKSYSAPIHHENIFAALFILNNALLGKINAVIEMYSIVSAKQQLELQLITSPVNKNIKASLADRRQPPAKLLDHILIENPNYLNSLIFKRLNNQTIEEKIICRIKSAVFDTKKGFVEYYKTQKSQKTETVPYRKFASWISKSRNRVKNKLP